MKTRSKWIAFPGCVPVPGVSVQLQARPVAPVSDELIELATFNVCGTLELQQPET